MKTPDFSKLTRNPLGVIGLFIWLIYSITGIVFATSVAALDYSIQLLFAVFVVLFPLTILGVFYRLVTMHHNKLYAPGDFKDERLFFRPATQDELSEYEQAYSAEASFPDAENVGKEGGHAADIECSTRREYAATEDSALDFVELTFGRNIRRHFVAELDGKKFLFDGVFHDQNRLDLFEVKYYRKPAVKREIIEAVLYRASSIVLNDAIQDRSREFRLWLVIVTDFEGEELREFERNIKDAVDTNNFTVEWMFIPKSKLTTPLIQE